MIITIDGPSGTGKSTVAKQVAKKLGYTFFDTGAMYRCFAWKISHDEINPENQEEVVASLQKFHFEIQAKEDRRYFVNHKDVTEAIRTQEISMIASQIAVYPEVRNFMVKLQRRFGRSCHAVFEGRDMGTVVFPDADLKIFLTAKPTVRAERRYHELLSKFPEHAHPTMHQIHEELSLRDKNDTTRSISPLKAADDAIMIDTSEDSVDEVVKKIIRLIPKTKSRFSTMKFPYWLVYTIARGFFKLFYRLEIYGEKHIRKGSGLFIANHTSFYDPPILSISCDEEVHFLARESLFEIPLLGRLIKTLNTHPVARESADMNALRQMIRLLSDGKKLIIFPEGTRSKTGKLHHFKAGFSFLAKKSKATVYPAYIAGAYEVWPVARKFPRLFGKVKCVFGSPIAWEEFEDLPKDEAEKRLIDRCMQAVENLKTWLENGAQGIPP
ncbi:MAG TPA: (d)CMP kinase [Chlamydiales bacterium]|nr:(d)CMP kinase [Chlamydiales bacterium]